MKLNICMILFLHYKPNMQVYPQIEICAYLRHFHHNVTWIIWSGESQHVQPFSFDGIRVYTTPEVRYFPGTWEITKILNLIVNTFRRIWAIYHILRKGKYDLISVMDFALDGLVAACIKRRYRVPFVFQLSNPLEQVWEENKRRSVKSRLLYYLPIKLHQFMATRLLHESDLILPISKWLKQHLVRQGIAESKILPCPSGVNPVLFGNSASGNIRHRYSLGNCQVVIYVGDMGRARGLNVLIKAFAKVAMGKRVKLLMAGGGKDEENLSRLATELNIGNKVIFTGRIPHAEIADFITAANIAVCPVAPMSYYKMSSPIKLFEYMVMAKPVVANEEILEQKEVLEESGAGVLVPFTAEAFADAIIKLLDNPKRANEMGRRGKQWVLKNRSYEILARQIEQRYVKLVEDRVKQKHQ